jgi:hypothetical protein
VFKGEVFNEKLLLIPIVPMTHVNYNDTKLIPLNMNFTIGYLSQIHNTINNNKFHSTKVFDMA